MIPAVMPTYARVDIAFSHGEGVYLFDKDEGRRYLDFCAGIAVNSLGHAHPHLVKTLTQQAANCGIHQIFIGFRSRNGSRSGWLTIPSPILCSFATQAPRQSRAASSSSAATKVRVEIPSAGALSPAQTRSMAARLQRWRQPRIRSISTVLAQWPTVSTRCRSVTSMSCVQR